MIPEDGPPGIRKASESLSTDSQVFTRMLCNGRVPHSTGELRKGENRREGAGSIDPPGLALKMSRQDHR